MSLQSLLLVGLGGCLGAVGRYLIGGWVLRWAGPQAMPWGTLLVNLSGCLIIGLLAGLATRIPALDGPLRLFLFTGLLGGFTTFSAFGLETVELLRRGDLASAVIYVLASVLLGLLLVAAGLKAASGAGA